MIIYNQNETEIIEIIIDDRSYRIREIMGDDHVMLYFSLPEYVEFPEGCYIEYKAQKYSLINPQNFKMQHSRNFEYTLIMHSPRALLTNVKFKFFTSSDPYRLNFSLTATPADFAALLIANMNDAEGASLWSVGDIIDSDPVLIDFNDDTCRQAIQKIAAAFSTEWDTQNRVLHLCKIEREPDSPINLAYGYDRGILPGITRTQYDSSRVINRLFVQTSDRNIDASVYGSTTLKMPKSRLIEYNSIVYITDPTGSYIERLQRSGRVTEGSLDATKIYPSLLGTVSSVTIVSEEKNLYDFTDTSIPESLDYRQQIIPFSKMTIIFQTGQLAGREFEVDYLHADRLFKIVPIIADSQKYPAAGIAPEPGDTYRVFHISLPSEYTTLAEEKVLLEAAKSLNENEVPKFSYRWDLQGKYAKKHWLEIGGYLEPGYFISFSDERFQPKPINIRIISVREFLNKPKSPTIEIANNISARSISISLNKIPEHEQRIERKSNETLQIARRSFSSALETVSMLENALLDFNGKINPVSIQTMQLLLGDISLQFRFVDNSSAPTPVNHIFTYDKTTKVFSAPAGIIQHMTLGINVVSSTHAPSDYKFWIVPSYTSPVLFEEKKKYYLYIRASKTTQQASFLLSEAPIAFEAETGYYHLLTGTLNSEYDGDRSFVEWYGWAEVLPGLLRIRKIASPDGQNFFDVENGLFSGKMYFKTGSSGLYNIPEFSDLVHDIDEVDSSVENLQYYITGAFHDGIIEEAEAKAIEKYINTISAERAAFEAQYNKLFINQYLSGSPKINLLNAKINYFSSIDSLISIINQAIADGKTTPHEKSSVDYAFNVYSMHKATFSTSIEEANQAIQAAIKSFIDSYAYLKDAIAGTTEVQGGLLLANVLLLKNALNQVTAGISGLSSNNLFLFANETDALSAALNDIATFLLRRDGTGNMGNLRFTRNALAYCSRGVDGRLGKAAIEFRGSPIPPMSDLVASFAQTVLGAGGWQGVTGGTLSGNWGYSQPVTVTAYENFSLRIQGQLAISIYNDFSTPISDSHATVHLVLYCYEGGQFTVVQWLASHAKMLDAPGSISDVVDVDEALILPKGTYYIRAEYQLQTKPYSADQAAAEASSLVMTASGASGNRQVIFGENGIARVKSGDNFTLISDDEGLVHRGPIDIPGVLASGTVDSQGTQTKVFGAKSSGLAITWGANGIATIPHAISHSDYQIHITVAADGYTARPITKGTQSIDIKIVNASGGAVTGVGFEYTIYGRN